MACKTCHQKKVKCSSTKPVCDYCSARRIECQYEEIIKPSRGKRGPRYRERLERLEQLLVSQQRSETVTSTDGISPLRDAASIFSQNDVTLIHSPDFTRTGTSLSSGTTTRSQHTENPSENRFPAPIYSSINGFSAYLADDMLGELLRGPTAIPPRRILERIERLGSVFSEPKSSHLHDDGPPIFQAEEYSRYVGASSGLLSLSTNVVAFFTRNQPATLKPEFKEPLEHCQTVLTGLSECVERLSRYSIEEIGFPNQYNYPLPSTEIATEYIDMYFDACQVIFPIVRRTAFKNAWRKSQEHSAKFDISWHMLQNAVLAVGAFTKISASTPDSYICAKEEGYRFFRNSLSMQAVLLSSRTNLMAVQALCVMSMFAQATGNPNLAYICSSFASSLAQDKGLHTAATPKGRGLHSDHRDDQERVFWVVYFFDKILALESGRPSIIDDADISCSFPENNLINSEDLCTATPEVFLNFARFAHVCSEIKRALYSATALNRDLIQLFPVRDALCIQLGIWLDSIPSIYNVKTTPFRISTLSAHIRPVRAILLRVAYLYAVCCIHRRFSSLFLERSPTTRENNEFQRSQDEYLRASRELILLFGQLEMDVDTPNWFFAYHLLSVSIPLFLRVIENPLNQSAGDDVSLLNVASGMFARLEFITAGDLAFTGVGDLARLATVIIAKAKLLNEAPLSTQRNTKDMARVVTGVQGEDPQEEPKGEDLNWGGAFSSTDQHLDCSESFPLDTLSNFQVLEGHQRPIRLFNTG